MELSRRLLIELHESSIIKIMNGLKSLDESGITYKVIEDLSRTQQVNYITKNDTFNKKKLGKKGLDILCLLSKGYSYNKIAEEKDITIDGVRYYIKKIFNALSVNSGRDAVRIYLTALRN